jgi:hypothetical protein
MIRIIQCLYPQRHCIVATAYDDARHTPEQARRDVASALARALSNHEIDPYCGICGSRDWHHEDAATPYATMDEAMPLLTACAQANAATRRLLETERN